MLCVIAKFYSHGRFTGKQIKKKVLELIKTDTSDWFKYRKRFAAIAVQLSLNKFYKLGVVEKGRTC